MHLLIDQTLSARVASEFKPKHEAMRNLFIASEAKGVSNEQEANKMRQLLASFFVDFYIACLEYGIDNAVFSVLKTAEDGAPLYLMVLPMAYESDNSIQIDILHDFDKRKLPMNGNILREFGAKLTARLTEPGIYDELLEAVQHSPSPS